MIASQQRHGDPHEAVIRREAVIVTMAIAEHFINADHSGEPAGNCHCQNDLLANRDAAVFRRRRISAGRAHFVSPFRLPQKDIDQDAGDHRKDEGDVQWNSLRQAGNKSTQRRQVRMRANRRCLHDRIAGNLVMILGEVAQERDRDEVQHDGVDYFMRSELCFEQTRNAAPNCAGDDRHDTAQWKQDKRRQVSDGRNYDLPRAGIDDGNSTQLNSHPGRGEGRKVKLALGAYIQKATAKRDGDSQTSEDQRRCIK